MPILPSCQSPSKKVQVLDHVRLPFAAIGAFLIDARPPIYGVSPASAHEKVMGAAVMRSRRYGLGALPSPLWGGVGGGGREMRHRATPTPTRYARRPSP